MPRLCAISAPTARPYPSSWTTLHRGSISACGSSVCPYTCRIQFSGSLLHWYPEDRLHSTLTHAHARHRLSQSGAVAARVTEAAGALQQLTRSRNHLLGVYHHRAAAAKEAQSKLSQGAAQLAHAGHSGVVQTRSLTALLEQYTARQILTDLDHSWWTLRAAFDAYLQVAEEQTDAFRFDLSRVNADLASKMPLKRRRMQAPEHAP